MEAGSGSSAQHLPETLAREHVGEASRQGGCKNYTWRVWHGMWTGGMFGVGWLNRRKSRKTPS